MGNSDLIGQDGKSIYSSGGCDLVNPGESSAITAGNESRLVGASGHNQVVYVYPVCLTGSFE